MSEKPKDISKLEGAELDYWVAKALGWMFFWSKHNYYEVTDHEGNRAPFVCDGWTPYNPCTGRKRPRPSELDAFEEVGGFSPSTEWSQGGPIIERERIGPVWIDGRTPHWVAMPAGLDVAGAGDTPLSAAMRAYVASKYGEQTQLTGEA